MRALALSLAMLLLACDSTGRATQTTAPSPTATSDVWAALRHSSRIVLLPPGKACPASPRHELGDAGTGQGQAERFETYAPIYAVGADPLQVGPVDASGYRYGNVLWVASPKNGGRVLIRGQRIDGVGEVRFGPGGDELHLDFGSRLPRTEEGWGALPSVVGVRSSGCYSVQIDGPEHWITLITIRVDAP